MTDGVAPWAAAPGPTTWAGRAGPYAASFAQLCAGAVDPLLDAVGVTIAEAGPIAEAGQIADGGPALEGTPAVNTRRAVRLLDVGTGPGTLAHRAAARGAWVIGVDPEAGMLDVARAAPIAAAGIEFRLAGVPGLPFPDEAFDVVTANFVINHVGDPRAAVADLARVTAPGGRVGVTVWPTDRGAFGRLWAEVISGSGAIAPPERSLPAELDFPRSPSGVSELLAGAGLTEVRVRLVEWDFRIDPELLWQGPAGGVVTIGAAVVAQPPDVQARMKQVYDEQIRPWMQGADLVLPSTALLATGVKS